MKRLAFAAASTALITVLVVLGTEGALAATDPIPKLQDCIVIDAAGARQTCTPEPSPPPRDPTDTPPPPTWTPVPDTATPTQTSTTTPTHTASASPRPTETPTATPTERESVAGAGSTAADGSAPAGAPSDGFLPDLPLSPAATLLLLGLLGLAGVVLLLISAYDYLRWQRGYGEVARWHFEPAWPVKVTGPAPKGSAGPAEPGQEWFDMDAAEAAPPQASANPANKAVPADIANKAAPGEEVGFNPQPEPPPDPGHEVGHKVSPGEAEGFNPQPEPPPDPGHEMGQKVSPGEAEGPAIDDQGRYKPKMPFDRGPAGANEVGLQDSAGGELSPDQAGEANQGLGPDDVDVDEKLGGEEGLQ